MCVHLSKLKKTANNSIVNVDLCFHLSSTVMSCHHAAPLVRQKPHVTCLVGFLQEADEVTQEQQSWGKPNEGNDGENWGPRFPLKGCMIYVSGVALLPGCNRGK